MRTRTLVASYDQVGAVEEHALAVETAVPQFASAERALSSMLSNYPFRVQSMYLLSCLP